MGSPRPEKRKKSHRCYSYCCVCCGSLSCSDSVSEPQSLFELRGNLNHTWQQD